MAHPVPPQKPSLLSFLARRGYVIAVVLAIVVAGLFYFAPDIQGDRDWKGPAMIIAMILAGLAVFLFATRNKGAP